DIAAMGGEATHAFIAIAIPDYVTPEMVEVIYGGMVELAVQSGVDIIGGDTVRSSGPLTLCLTVQGRVESKEMLTRAGAHAGDALYVTGSLGRAAAGLKLLDDGRAIPEDLADAVTGQLRPTPRLMAGRALAQCGFVTAMMDLSDGVATDLHRMCAASGVGTVVDGLAIPVDEVVGKACNWLGAGDPLQLALTGGEDFELMFTAPAKVEAALRRFLAPLKLTCIGVMTAGRELLLRTEQGVVDLPWGFTHF
ncbi:MAG: thiamine-phosphate kinase, partial [bacterium]